MPSIDPSQLLKALSPLLLPTGGLRGTVEATRIVSLMKDANKLVSKCLYLNIVKSTELEDVLTKFISTGGWDVLNKWLQQAKDEENTPLLMELLKVYQKLPVTVDDLKKDNTARSIKSLNKHQDDSVKNLSTSVVDTWMKIIKGKGSNDDNDKAKKKKKKDKERERDREKDSKESSRDKDRHRKDDKHSRSSDKKDHSSSHSSSSRKEHSRRESKENSRDSRDSRDSNSSDKKSSSSSSLSDGMTHKDNGEKASVDNSEELKDRLSGGSGSGATDKVKTNSSGKEEEGEDKEKTKRKPKTVRVFTNKFRSVFDEDDDPLPPIKKKTPEELKGGLPIAKRSSTDIKDDPPEKIPRLMLKMPPIIPDASGTSPTNTSPPEVTHGRIKIIPPKKPPAHEIHESNVFMNELTKSSYTHGVIKRKKKPSAVTTTTSSSRQPAVKSPTSSTAPATPTTPVPPTPTTPPTPVSPMTAMAQKLPSVPSFYRDTLESTDETEPAKEQKEPSPPPLEKMITDAGAEETAQTSNNENEEPPSIDMEMKEESATAGETATEGEPDSANKVDGTETPSENPENANEEGKDDAVPPAKKKKKKKVSWAEDANLRQFFYFEMDETERENVNRPKTFNELKKQEMMQEGRAMESAKRLIKDNMVEVLPWRRPPLIDNIVSPVEPGCNSKEKEIQREREQGVLQALFFSKQMLPDSPAEPDLESVEPVDTKIIPLEDETASAEEYEHTYNFDPTSSMPYDPAFDITENLGGTRGTGNPGGGMNNIQLPPDLSNILASIQQQSIATGGQSLQANSAVMNNVQGILQSIMHGGPGNNSDELINKLRVALEPLKNQISIPNMNHQQEPGQFPPQGPQRQGLLGNAPPGYNPMMGGGPRPFGPQGPGMGRGMEAEGWNMGMGPGPGPMGPGFHPMQGGPMMAGPPGRPRGPQPMRGGGQRRGQRAVCRHFSAHGSCRYGNSCSFLHPGVNGPPLN